MMLNLGIGKTKNLKKLISIMLVAVMAVAFFPTVSIQKVKAADSITYIDYSNNRETMMVDGVPFFYSGVQISATRLHDPFGTNSGIFGWSWSELACTFNQAADDGFTVMAVPICWKWVEPTQDSYDWNDVEAVIDNAYNAGIKLEILWFGHDVCTKQEANPSWVNDMYTHVKKSDGSDVYMIDGLPKMDKCDTDMLAEEKAVIADMMDHVKYYQDLMGYPHVLVGIQLLNEPSVVQMIDYPNWTIPTPRSYSTFANNKWNSGGYTDVNEFNADVLYDYLNGLGQAIKTSDYPIWTRVNFCPAVEANTIAPRVITRCNNNRAATNLDFVGLDPYVDSLDSVYNYSTGDNTFDSMGITMTTNYNAGTNLAMIMENGGQFTNTDKLMWNTIAGDGRYHIWEYNQSAPWSAAHANASAITCSQQRTGEYDWLARDGNALTEWSTPDLPSNNCNEWIKYEFASDVTIDKYSLTNSPDPDYVTRDWTFQYSTDGSNWMTADTVTGNTYRIYGKELSSPITAKYLMINITKCCKDGMVWPAVRIPEFSTIPVGFYDLALYNTDVTNKTISARSHVANVKIVNQTLAKDSRDIARLKMGGADAVTFNRTFAENASAALSIGGKNIGFATNNPNGWASVIGMKRDANTYVFLCYGGSATITLPGDMTVTSYDLGYYDANDNWVKVSDCGRGDAWNYWVGSGYCLRITY